MIFSFKEYFENLKFSREIEPNSNHMRFYVSDPKNPQQVAHWRKITSKKVFSLPLAEERFIHFSLKESIEQIFETKKIGYGLNGVFAVSTTYGIWLPDVQYSHIIRKSKDRKVIPPADLKKIDDKKLDNLLNKGWRVPKFSEELSAIIFKTKEMPKVGNVEEVYWDKEISIFEDRILSSREAINILKHCPYRIGNEDLVEYY